MGGLRSARRQEFLYFIQGKPGVLDLDRCAPASGLVRQALAARAACSGWPVK